MGKYMNPGNAAFQEASNSDIFVDKTEMIQVINSVVKTMQKYVSISRPRRFGKSMAVDMLCAYYDREADSRSLFEKKKLAACAPVSVGGRAIGWDSYLGQFDVIRIVMTDFFKKGISVEQAIEKMQRLVIRDIQKAYPEADYFDDTDLPQTMDDVYDRYGCQFVIVIDEWDAVFRVWKEDKTGQELYLDFLRNWLKDKRYVALAYMTGILPIKKYGEHSALNMFAEYSMMAPLQFARFTGFTEEEVTALCVDYGRDYKAIKDWYDGYEVSDMISSDPGYKIQKETGEPLRPKRYSLYSPLSVVSAVSTGRIRNYWNKTETYEALAEYIRKDFDGLKEAVTLLMNGARLRIDISTYQNDMTTFHGKDDVLSLLIHLGYLGFDDETSEVFIPNREILDEFRTSTKSDEWNVAFQSFEKSMKLLRATWDGREDTVAELLEDAHNTASNKTYNDEAALSYAIQLAYYAAQNYYTPVVELDTGKGYADLVYLPSPRYPEKPVLLVELKYEKTAETALDQIRRNHYPDRLKHYKGNILLVGINYNKEIRTGSVEFKHHSCKIERA